MIDAKLLATLRPLDDPSTIDVYGVWIPRRGDNVRFPVEVVANSGVFLTATLFQKSYAETGNGTSAGVSVTFDQSTGRQTMELLGAKELVRVKLSLDPGSDLSGSQIGLTLFRFLQPVWFEAVKV